MSRVVYLFIYLVSFFDLIKKINIVVRVIFVMLKLINDFLSNKKFPESVQVMCERKH